MAGELNVREWTWNPKQVQFITSTARYTAYVGGVGCGKTSALCRRAMALAMKYPDSLGILFRFTYTEVSDILIPQFFEIFPPQMEKKWRRSEGMLVVRAGLDEHGAYQGNGESTILFRNLDDPKKFRSHNLSWFGISQADDQGITIEHWYELVGRLRRRSGRWGTIQRQYGFLEANFRGHNWIWQLFTDEGRRTLAHQTPQTEGLRQRPLDPADYALIIGTTYDNAENLPPDYLSDLEAMPEEWRKRYVTGSWDEVGGRVYPELTPDHIQDRYWHEKGWTTTIPETWWKYRAIDHGVRNATAALWAAVSPSGTVYIYDEYFRPGEHARIHAEAIREKDPTGVFQWTVLDRAAFAREGSSGESPAHQYFDAGVPVIPSPRHHVASGITIVKKYLSQRDPVSGQPRLVIHPRCHNLIREMREYVWEELAPAWRDRKNEPEKPRKVKDHLLDALRYLLVSTPAPPPHTRVSAQAAASALRRQQEYERTWEV